MEGVRLYGAWFSPYVKRVETALKLKNVVYEYKDEDLSKKSPDLLRLNPTLQKVPILVHNGKAIVESLDILEYIDEMWEGPSILPKDPQDRAMSQSLAKFVEKKCVATTWKAFWGKTLEDREKSKKEAEEALTILDDKIKGNKFFGGEEIGLVDLGANYIAFWLDILQEEGGVEILSEKKFPNLWEWKTRFCDESFVKEFLPNRKKMGLGFKMALEISIPLCLWFILLLMMKNEIDNS